MKLTAEQIRECSKGAVRIEEDGGYIKFNRFTKEQEDLYKNNRLYIRTFATAGIKLLFKTDSENIRMKVFTAPSTNRSFFAFDFFVNKKYIGALSNFSEREITYNNLYDDFPLGEFEKTFKIGKGLKEVSIYFPWSVCAFVTELEVDDGAVIIPVKTEKRLLCFGDSITHGYDALRPSARYISKLADFLGAEEINKAVGGEVFFPELANTKEDFIPDYITVAYGTNDWNGRGREDFKQSCKLFLEDLSRNYLQSKIFVITPIWRKDLNEYRECGAFNGIENYIKKKCEPMKNTTVISGFNLIPHDESLFSDYRLHPNDAGFEYYFKNLIPYVCDTSIPNNSLSNKMDR